MARARTETSEARSTIDVADIEIDYEEMADEIEAKEKELLELRNASIDSVFDQYLQDIPDDAFTTSMVAKRRNKSIKAARNLLNKLYTEGQLHRAKNPMDGRHNNRYWYWPAE